MPSRVPAEPRDSQEVLALFERFASEGRMPRRLSAWLNDRTIQEIAPYKVFDDVWFVGVRWVSAWVLKTSEGAVLIDTLHEPFVGRLVENLGRAGVAPGDVRWVLMTHGHFDHVGGCWALRKRLPNARFAMSRRGWDEAKADALRTGRFRMPPEEKVLKDGDVVRLGGLEVKVLETPGHTLGTCSFVYDVRAAGEVHRAVTVGGQGLNGMRSARQLNAYVRSMRRLLDPALGIDVDLTAHPFATGLTEQIPAVKAWRPGAPHPLVGRAEYAARLERLIAEAERFRRVRFGA
ncbi:MBL fold metallo-hydrolase [Sutterella sp.]|uniref:MBL fold metallo-hydrolase n=1 Tax=Sutterella sp. TaxID=1981025 RepID=UPI003FD81F49